MDDWTEVVSRVLFCEGMRSDDMVIHAFGLGSFVGGLPLKDATEHIGALFVPIGTAAGDRVVQSIRDLGATVLMRTPSYATHLAEYCRDRLGMEPAELGLRKLLVGAEPGGSIPAVRARLEADFGATVSDGVGNADVFPIYLASCPEQDGLHLCAEDQLLAEVVDPDSGERLEWADGVEGELVVTHLHRECVPLVRFRVRDRVVVNAAPCSCGRTSPFKLTTGTWVSVATVRGALVSAARVLSDAVITGHDRDEVTAIAWLQLSEARELCGLGPDDAVSLDHPVLRAHLATTLAALASTTGSAGRVVRLILSADPPDLDAGEITDKGYINQRVVIERRSELVERLYAPEPDAEVVYLTPVRADR